MAKPYNVIGVYKTREGAARAVDELVAAGFARDRFSMLVSDEARARYFTVERHTKASKGVAVGGVTGGALGALVAGLTAVAAVSVPGVGLLAAGPLLAAFTGAGVGGAAGTLVGGLVGFGVSEHEAKAYGKHLQSDCILIGVEVEGRKQAETVKRVFSDTGALQIEAAKGQALHT